jgi:hypothetical protein
MFDTLASQIGFAIAVLVTAFAFLKGDEPERVGAGAYMLGLFASQLVQDKGALYGTQWGLMAIDTLFLAVCIGLAWKSRRAWPVWACALQSLIVMSHLLTLVHQHRQRRRACRHHCRNLLGLAGAAGGRAGVTPRSPSPWPKSAIRP